MEGAVVGMIGSQELKPSKTREHAHEDERELQVTNKKGKGVIWLERVYFKGGEGAFREERRLVWK